VGVTVTEDVTTVDVTSDTTVTVTENVTSVSVSDNTATLTIQPSETSVAVSGNTTSINVLAESQEILVNESSYLGNFGGQTLDGSLTTTGTITATNLNVNSDASGADIYDVLVNFRAKYSSTGLATAAKIGVLGSSSSPSRMIIGTGQAAFTFFDGFGSRQIYSANASTGGYVDNTCNFGTSFARWKLGYFASGTTTSSDRNEKQDIEELNDAELRVATKCKTLLRKYRRTEAIQLKGEGARIHFGIIAQDLQDAFTAEGLDAHRYAMFMEDIWYETEEGGIAYPSLEEVPEELRDIAVEKNRLGVRYEQLLAFIIASL